MIRADLHIHTIFSNDSSIHPKILVEQLIAHPYINAIAVTDHNTGKGYYKVRELATAYPDVLIIPGIEVSTVHGDILLLGSAEVPPEPWTIENILDFAKEVGCLAIAAHPYRQFGLGDLVRNYKFDAIETLNGGSSPQSNAMAGELAKSMGLPGVAGSDAHSPQELWTAYTEVQASMDLDEVLRAIKMGKTRTLIAKNSIHF
ncbi:MAG: PHP domain-containing protein [Candidatus Bathyarchaeia archaeon]|nr:PHP domain-containing protein [Candidatus Bathyarchaeota archaeon]